MPADGIPKDLLHDAPPASRIVRQNTPKFLGIREVGIRNAVNESFGVERQLDILLRPRLIRHRVSLKLNPQLDLLTMLADIVEALQTGADRIDQVMAASATRVCR